MSLGTTTRSLVRTAKTRFPGASDADLHRFVHLLVDTALENNSRGIKDDDLFKLADEAFEAAVASGEGWAVSLKNSYRDSVIKPLVEKAREKGVDPIPAIVMQTDLTEAQAGEMVAALDASAGDIAVDVFDGDDDQEVSADADGDPSAVYGGSAATAA
ncbi:hypothetical protein ACFW2V_12515 [Streptomyces sp. NPDC058947]|uniref:hypothetical protein n=1 Tax=Streptomyces sp. NPDC058947 TaxID=3346675 RepID=UPI0036B052FC